MDLAIVSDYSRQTVKIFAKLAAQLSNIHVRLY